MPLTDVQAQMLAVAQVGDVDPATGDPVAATAQGTTGIVMQNIGYLWEKYSTVAEYSSLLRDLYVRRDALDMVIGVLEVQVDIEQDNFQLELKLSQRVKARLEQRAAVQAEVERVEKKLTASLGTKIGDITKQVPIPPPDFTTPPDSELFRPDANAPVYVGGSPYYQDRDRVR